jgi:DNA-binding NarL/FixJ family response regulator
LIRVLIEASSAMTRAGIEAMLAESPNLERTAVAEDADVVVTDHENPLEHELPVVQLISGSQAGSAIDALRAGARAVLSLDASPAQLAAAIEGVAAGLVVLQPEDLESWAGPARHLEISEPLTARETEVLRMIAEGAANKAIAHRMGISEHTVKFHITSILQKLNASSRTEAVMVGIRQGLVLL